MGLSAVLRSESILVLHESRKIPVSNTLPEWGYGMSSRVPPWQGKRAGDYNNSQHLLSSFAIIILLRRKTKDAESCFTIQKHPWLNKILIFQKRVTDNCTFPTSTEILCSMQNNWWILTLWICKSQGPSPY